MRSTHGLLLSVFAVALLVLGGCQTGKLAMPKLAFWNSGSQTLRDDYIEPPSHQFSPETDDAEAAIAKNDESSGDGPPSKPSGSNSLEEFEAELAETYRQLQAQTKPATTNVSTNSAQPNSVPSSSAKSGLAAKPSPRYEVSPTRSTKQAAQIPTNNNSDFSGGMTQYEKIAKNTMGNGAMPGAASPLTPLSQPVVTSQADHPARRIQNPYSQTTAATTPKPPAASAIGTNMDQSSASKASYEQYPSTPHKPFEPLSQLLPNNASAAVQTTPVQTAPVQTQVTQPTSGQLPSGLMQGQGTYAPGSVKAPQPMQPDQVKAPANPTVSPPTSQAPSYGGGFQPN